MAVWPIPWLLLIGVVATVIAVEASRVGAGRWWRRRVSRRRLRRARDGEVAAEALLEDLGYRVLERQPRRSFSFEIDGRPLVIELRADLLVALKGRRLVAEVKTGATAPRIETKSTRRQLLEYRIAYRDVDGVLLVDPEAREVHEIGFPLQARSKRWPIVARAFVAGGLAGVVVSIVALWSFLGWAR